MTQERRGAAHRPASLLSLLFVYTVPVGCATSPRRSQADPIGWRRRGPVPDWRFWSLTLRTTSGDCVPHRTPSLYLGVRRIWENVISIFMWS